MNYELFILTLFFIIVLCKSQEEKVPKSNKVKIVKNNDYGEYIADGNGLPLYILSIDDENKSRCTKENTCLDDLIPFTLSFFDSIEADEGIDKKLLDKKSGQVTYNKRPLYYHRNEISIKEDKEKVRNQGDKISIKYSGNVSEDALIFLMSPDGKVNFSLSPYKFDFKSKASCGTLNGSCRIRYEVQYLTDFEGRTLYSFSKDKMMVPDCTGNCEDTWIPYTLEDEIIPSENIRNDLINYVERKLKNGTYVDQLTYNGWPLYYNKDEMIWPGKLTNQGKEDFKGNWYILDLEGEPVIDAIDCKEDNTYCKCGASITNFIVDLIFSEDDKCVRMVKKLESDTYGSYIANVYNRTFYMTGLDEKEKSNCDGDCLKSYPAFVVDNDKEPLAGRGVDEKLLGTISHSSGKKQVTYNGWPLYLYSEEEKEDSENSEDSEDKENILAQGKYENDRYSFLLSPEGKINFSNEMTTWSLQTCGAISMSCRTRYNNTYITDQKGITLYAYAGDSFMKSNCNDACATEFPPYLKNATELITFGFLIDSSLISTIKRPDQSLQITYNGRPLYYQKDEKIAKPGALGFHRKKTTVGEFFILNTNGEPVIQTSESKPAADCVCGETGNDIINTVTDWFVSIFGTQKIINLSKALLILTLIISLF